MFRKIIGYYIPFFISGFLTLFCGARFCIELYSKYFREIEFNSVDLVVYGITTLISVIVFATVLILKERFIYGIIDEFRGKR